MNDLIPFKEMKPAVRILACLFAFLMMICGLLFMATIITIYLVAIVLCDLFQVFIETPFNAIRGFFKQKRKYRDQTDPGSRSQ